MRPRDVLVIGAFVWGALGAGTALAREEVPTYTNAVVVSMDKAKRTIVVRNTDGVQQRLDLDEAVTDLGDIRAGDQVIMTVRGETDRPRVTALSKSVTTAPSKAPAIATTTPAPPEDDLAGPRRAFESRVSLVAQQAARVDALWSQFVNACDVRQGPAGSYDNGREWFALWDGTTTRADLSNGFCRDLYNQIVGLGESVKRSMSGAEETARRDLDAGDMRQIRQRYGMDWDGWDRSAPARQTP
jgi:hypothetical protein